MAEADDAWCDVEECGRRVWRQGLCATHFKRLQRGGRDAIGGPINDGLPPGEVLNPKERVLLAFIQLVECDSENDDLYDFMEKRALRASERWLEARGWSPPSPRGRPMRARRRQRVQLTPLEQLEIWPSRFWTV